MEEPRNALTLILFAAADGKARPGYLKVSLKMDCREIRLAGDAALT